VAKPNQAIILFLFEGCIFDNIGQPEIFSFCCFLGIGLGLPPQKFVKFRPERMLKIPEPAFFVKGCTLPSLWCPGFQEGIRNV
jgi:hypothetical protein